MPIQHQQFRDDLPRRFHVFFFLMTPLVALLLLGGKLFRVDVAVVYSLPDDNEA